ncbi:MAG: phosphotriesterase family protein [Christensenellales bacterium]
MAQINTVLGKIDAKDLGPTLIHEHILIADWSMRMAFSDWVDIKEFIGYAVKKLKRAKAGGIKTIVDCTPANLGRDIHVMREVSEKAQINIIASTGLYHFEDWWIRDKEPAWFAEQFIKECEHGIMGTGSLPGVIKCATDVKGVTPVNRNLLKIASIIHKNTDLPIITHASVSNHAGLAQQDVFIEEGVDISTVLIGHCNDSKEADYLESILKRGSYIGMDRFGVHTLARQEDRVWITAEMYRRGYADKMLLSCDHSAFLDYTDQELFTRKSPWEAFKAVDLDTFPEQYSYLTEVTVPQLQEAGVPQEAINRMLVDNPKRFLQGQP